MNANKRSYLVYKYIIVRTVDRYFVIVIIYFIWEEADIFHYEMVRVAILAAGAPDLSSIGWCSLTCSRPPGTHRSQAKAKYDDNSVWKYSLDI